MNNYKLLPALGSLLTTLNLTDSARALNVTQSSMSKTLSQIREAFQDPILIREGNQYLLTERAKSLKQQLPLLLRQIDSLYLSAQFDPLQCQRQFSLALTPFFAPEILPLLCEKLEEQTPNANISCVLWQEEQLKELAAQEIDLVAVMAEEIPENLYGKEIGQDHYVIVCRDQHPFRHRSISVEDYLNAKHILVNGISERHRQVDLATSSYSKERRVFAKLPSFQSALETLCRTDSIITAPRHLVEQYAKQRALCIKPLPFELPAHKYYLLWHAKHHHDPAHQWFRTFLEPEFKAHLEKR
ncbi:LysR family transcriptional regulator [Shewanella colwelliana]|uniref:LysR family transcriptional regulator n=1 Tax=Shewanella colwelliana TaxID=23 RepID=UPI0022AF3873|nr:LysR family transcriptional regulator [Shewanella colwelliana]MCZ4339465.1 LysR family transcriptional regulator [Shewanella colwelliana]